MKSWITESSLAWGLIFTMGCSATTTNVGTLILPTSNRTIDVVQHRSDSKGCAELVVLQTYDSGGLLIDSKEGRGQSLPCLLTGVVVESGGRLGAAAIVSRGLVGAAKATRPDNIVQGVSTTVMNNQSQTQGQAQSQGGGHGGHGGHGNNGGGNGDGDGSNPGTGHHHGNGDNN